MQSVHPYHNVPQEGKHGRNETKTEVEHKLSETSTPSCWIIQFKAAMRATTLKNLPLLSFLSPLRHFFPTYTAAFVLDVKAIEKAMQAAAEHDKRLKGKVDAPQAQSLLPLPDIVHIRACC